MKFRCSYDPNRFDLRDSYWEFKNLGDGLLTAKVFDVNIPSGDDQGEVIESALVTFDGFRLTWIERMEGDDQVRLTEEEAVEFLTRGSYFVFSYGTDDHECELAGVDNGEFFAMLFSYDSAEIGWDDFKQPPVGTLVKIQ